MNKKAEEWGKKFESIKHTDDMEMLYQGEDISKLIKPKPDKHFALIVAVAVVVIGILMIASLRFHFVPRISVSDWCYNYSVNQIIK